MILVLPVLHYFGLLLALLFLTLSIASGLYYLSEAIESHTVLTKKLLTHLITGIYILLLLLYLIDGLPLSLLLLSALSHAVYSRNLRRFPVVQLTDAWFLSSAVLVFLNHVLWFRWWANRGVGFRGYETVRTALGAEGRLPRRPDFGEITAFFGVCVWLVPFVLFISLSAQDWVLPSVSETAAMGEGEGTSMGMGDGKRRRRKEGLAKVVMEKLGQWVADVGEAAGWWRGERRREY
ncbi:MAG: erv26 super protein [Trizodia sp. TS-e1964]|nr:MAG: erv26 super protein [Trizodia sp. TS-e1964]